MLDLYNVGLRKGNSDERVLQPPEYARLNVVVKTDTYASWITFQSLVRSSHRKGRAFFFACYVPGELKRFKGWSGLIVYQKPTRMLMLLLMAKHSVGEVISCSR